MAEGAYKSWCKGGWYKGSCEGNAESGVNEVIKILVFDLTPAAVSVGKYIEKELPVQVEKVVDSGCNSREEIAERISAYVGKMDVIVISNPLLLAKYGSYLKRRFPAQKFIFFGADLPSVVAEHQKVLILTPKKLRTTEYYQMMKAECQEQDIRELDCEKWIAMKDSCYLEWCDKVKQELTSVIGARLIVNSAELVAVYDQLAEIIDWRVNLVDLRRGIVTTIKEYFATEKKRGNVCFQREKSTCGRVTYERKTKRLT